MPPVPKEEVRKFLLEYGIWKGRFKDNLPNAIHRYERAMAADLYIFVDGYLTGEEEEHYRLLTVQSYLFTHVGPQPGTLEFQALPKLNKLKQLVTVGWSLTLDDFSDWQAKLEADLLRRGLKRGEKNRMKRPLHEGLHYCLACRSPMKEVSARLNPGKKFLGCSRFPECRATRPLPEKNSEK